MSMAMRGRAAAHKVTPAPSHGGWGQTFKAIVPSADLRRAVNLANMVCEKRTTIPILSHVRVGIVDGILSISATDQDNEITSAIAVESAGAGSVMVPAIELRKIVSCLTGPIELEITPGDMALTIRGSHTTFTVSCMGADDYAALFRSSDYPGGFLVPAGDFRKLIAPIQHNNSTEERRYYLNGVHLDAGGSTLRATASDGHRLGRAETPAPEGMLAPDVIIPRKTVRVLMVMLATGDEPLSMAFADQGKFSRGDATLRAKMIDGKFPDVDRVIPKGNNKIVTLDTKMFAGLLRRVTAACSKDDPCVRLLFERDTLDVSVNSSLWGSSTGDMTVSYGGPPLEIGFNRRYLADILRVGGERTKIALLDATSPVMFTNPDDAGTLQVLVPMRV